MKVARYHQLQTFQAPVQIYSSYRLILSIIFLGLALKGVYGQEKSTIPPALIISALYTVLAVCFWISAFLRSMPLVRHTFIGFIVDIVFIALLEYTSLQQGITLDLILIVSVAAGSIVFISRLGTAIAAIATIFLCFKEFLLIQVFTNQDANGLRTAVLGITFFATSWITQNLARRLSETEIISSQQALDIEHLQHLNQAIISRMNTGITVLNQALEVEMMNLAATRLLSAHPAQQIDPHPGTVLLKSHVSAWLKKQRTNQLIQINKQSPEIKLGFTFLRGEERIVVFLEDNTKLKQHAQQLKNTSLGRLAGSIAHEIRNPLAAVSYAAQLLQETELRQDQLNLLEILMRHVTRMNDIVETVLQISRRDPPNIISIALQDWLAQYLENVFPSQSHQYISLNIEKALEVDFDPSYLGQVCTNLIENALHALQDTPEQAREIRIEAGYIENLHQTYLNISNNGPSINDEQSAQLFEPFFTTSKSGTGLGLFLCREICELNHARIHLLPSTQGCCFQILFKPRGGVGV